MTKKPTDEDYEALASYRYAMRKFLRFSKDEIASRAQLTPEQYEAMVALRALADDTGLTIGRLSERLQVKHHTAVSLVGKMVAAGIVARSSDGVDARKVYLTLTRRGQALLAKLASAHRAYLRANAGEMMAALARLQQ